MKSLFKRIYISFALVALLASCEKDNEIIDNDVTVFKAMLFGASQVPSNASTARGKATLTVDENTMRFTIVATYTGLTPTAGHIHNGVAAVNGPALFPFEITASPISYQSGVLTQEQVDELFAGRMYINLHSEEYPDGEIRGQLFKQ